MLSRRQAILGNAGLAGTLASGTFTGRPATATVASPVRANRRIPYGACVNLAPLQNESEYRIVLETYCQQLTPEYGLFWDYLARRAVSSISTSPTRCWLLPTRMR
jgi:hypothetical protein